MTTSYAGPNSKTGRIVYESEIQPTVVLPAVAANLTLPSVVLPTNPLPPGARIDKVFAGISWRKQVESSASVNAIDGDQDVEVQLSGAATWADAIDIPDNTLSTAASATEGGILILGDIDVAAVVDGAGTYDFRWASALVDGASLTLHDVQTFLIVVLK